MFDNNYLYQKHKLIFNDKICIKEMDYKFFQNQEFDHIWANGLKKVYDHTDTKNIYTFEKALSYMDEDQIKMLQILNKLFLYRCPNISIDYIFVNYLMNYDKSKNLIKQILIVFRNNKNFLIVRVGQYSFNINVWKDFMNTELVDIKNNDMMQDSFWQQFKQYFLKEYFANKSATSLMSNTVNKLVITFQKKQLQKIKLSLNQIEAEKNQLKLMLQYEVSLWKYENEKNKQLEINTNIFPANVGLMQTGILFKPNIQLKNMISIYQKKLLEIISKYDYGLINEQIFQKNKLEIIKEMGLNYQE